MNIDFNSYEAQYNRTYNEEIRYFAADYIKTRGITDDVVVMYLADENLMNRFFYRQNREGADIIEYIPTSVLDDGTVNDIRPRLVPNEEKAEIRQRLRDRKAIVLETGNFDKLLKWVCTDEEYEEAIEKMRAQHAAR